MCGHSHATSVVCLGHSFIRRLQAHCAHATNVNMSLDTSKRVVSFVTKGGMLVHHLHSYQDQVMLHNPHLVCIDIGTNDLESTSVPPQVLARQVYHFAQSLISSGVKSVVIMEVFFRTREGKYGTPSESRFKQRAHQYNNAIKALVGTQTHLSRSVHFWHYKGFVTNWRSYIQDSVHLTQTGMNKYFKSVRNCILLHTNKMLK